MKKIIEFWGLTDMDPNIMQNTYLKLICGASIKPNQIFEAKVHKIHEN